ncbi:hypothetical protein K1W54_06890 [Micromonospora sp. CPCC 205371]|nr:hypothetical protein [Micromonospora sp. CPCC 205371]
MDVERLTGKYTGVPVTFEAIAAQHGRGGVAAALADALIRAVAAIDAAERELVHHVAAIDHATAAVTLNLAAGPGERVPSLNPLGELQSRGSRFDALIAVRAACVDHLKELVRLWQPPPTAARPATPDASPANIRPARIHRPAAPPTFPVRARRVGRPGQRGAHAPSFREDHHRHRTAIQSRRH